MRKNYVISAACISSMLIIGSTVTGCSSCMNVGENNASSETVKAVSEAEINSASLNNFKSDESSFLCGYESEATFTVETSLVSDAVELYNDESLIGSMHDDGLQGDVDANDGIYTYVMNTATVLEAANIEYYAKSGELESNRISVKFFDMPTEEEYSFVQSSIDKMNEIEDKYADDEDYVSYDQIPSVISEVADYIEELSKEGNIIDYSIDDNNIIAQFSSGYQIVYMPNVKDVDLAGSDTEMTIITCQPFYTDCMHTHIRTYNNLNEENTVLHTAENIDNAFSDYSYSLSDRYLDNQVTLDTIKSFSSNQIIIWHGHGGYDSKKHSFLCTGEDVPTFWNITLDYLVDNINSRIYFASNGKICFTSKFISKYCKNLDNDFIYLGACLSGKDSTLAEAFLDKGATAVVGYSDTVNRSYNVKMISAVMDYMTTVNHETSNYYTLKEALSAAQNDLGENDYQWAKKVNYLNVNNTSTLLTDVDYAHTFAGAYPVIFGSVNADDYRFKEMTAEYSTITPELVKKHTDTDTQESEENIATTAANSENGSVTIAEDSKEETTAAADTNEPARTESETTVVDESEFGGSFDGSFRTKLGFNQQIYRLYGGEYMCVVLYPEIHSIKFLNSTSEAPDDAINISNNDIPVLAWKVVSEDQTFPDKSKLEYGSEYCCKALTPESLVYYDVYIATDGILKISDARSIFGGCEALTSLDLTGVNTSEVTDMSNMFRRCYNLSSLNLSSIDVSHVTNMTDIFYCCSSLKSLPDWYHTN